MAGSSGQRIPLGAFALVTAGLDQLTVVVISAEARAAAFDTGADDLLRRAEMALKQRNDPELQRMVHALAVTIDDLRYGGDRSATIEAAEYIDKHGQEKHIERRTAEKARIKRAIEETLRDAPRAERTKTAIAASAAVTRQVRFNLRPRST